MDRKTDGERMVRVGLVVLLAMAAMLVWAAWAEAGEGLYLNKDGTGWVLEAWLPSFDECDKAARRAIRNKEALGAGCKPLTANLPDPKPNPSPGHHKTQRQIDIDARQQHYDGQKRAFEQRFTAPVPTR